MKKLIYLIVAIVILGLIVSGCLPVVPTVEKDETTSLTKSPPGIDLNGAHFNLNIIGKKSDWSGGGSYNNPDRHTMFVPEDTSTYIPPGSDEPCSTPNGLPGITIWMTQCGWGDELDCDDFAVTDGNAFDDCTCRFRLAPGEYKVYIVAKAKPPKPGEDYYTDITGWVQYIEPSGTVYNYFDIGTVRVKKSKKWEDATDLFYVSAQEEKAIGILAKGEQMWVFKYLDMLVKVHDYEEAAYFWQYDNHGNKLVKVRFYKVK